MIRIWKYHAQPPDDARLANDLLYGAGRYYNRLVEIERKRLQRFAAIRREHAPDLAALEDAYQTLDEQIEEAVRGAKRERAQHYRQTGQRSRAVSTEAERAIDALRTQRSAVGRAATPLRRAFRDRLKEPQEIYRARAKERAAALADRSPGDERPPGPRTRARANAEVLEDMLADETLDPAWRAVTLSDSEALAAAKAARAECGLPTGVYQQVEDAVERARKDAGPQGPRFRRNRRSPTFSGGRGRSISRRPRVTRAAGDARRTSTVSVSRSDGGARAGGSRRQSGSTACRRPRRGCAGHGSSGDGRESGSAGNCS